MTESTAPVTNRTHAQGRVKRFGVVGILNTLIDYGVFIALTKWFSLPLDRVWIAKFVSGATAMANSFYWNRRWVFRHTHANLSAQASRFLVTTLVSVFGIQLTLTQLFASVWPQPGRWVFDLLQTSGLTSLAPTILTQTLMVKTIAFGLATTASLAWNYWAYRHIVFHHRYT